MSTSITLLIPLLLGIGGFIVATSRARRFSDVGSGKMHSLPKYHGYLVALSIIVPAYLIIFLWLFFEQSVLRGVIVNALPDALTNGATPAQVSLLISQVQQAASGATFGNPDPAIVEVAGRLREAVVFSRWALPLVIVLVGLATAAVLVSRIAKRFRARNYSEAIMRGLLIFCATLSILATLGILLSLLFEGLQFFSRVSPIEFFFGTRWDPQIAIRPDQIGSSGAFGAIPVFMGTLTIAFTALFVAIPVGIFAAIYMAEFASPHVRGVVKPLIELLAGIPTIVYGFFAVLVISPFIREWLGSIGIAVSPTAAIVPGLVMGVMLIPFISSLSDDAITAVPQSLKDGSLGLGANRAETVTKVLLPAALPGIVGGVLLATTRAIGETMIVVMAAGLTANMTVNPLQGVTTVTVQIVALLTGDTEFDNPKTLAAFGLGLTLFLATLLLNLVAIQIVKRFREQYD
ncbi:phosphate ABC transporter permease subunit PstC [Antarcticirhabdus aurantiaca]|uniref:Phosphate ABC transporter permease subunit PstC n=1 Tax=Antarcticirhabdus aurantiaca TaxID=2606717 RepID=A0ACD4NIP7_9HYPH|nr:phosphate ABC transporter permease subunit PstC [Antarcticirhabdus aurantiaca]WAJ26651.1 phosphate ABC transporter permease subunit PstC [Jeongeuplla avenae]